MVKSVYLFAIATLFHEAAVFAAAGQAGPAIQPQAQSADSSTPGPGKICKHVVSSEPEAKPYPLCLAKSEWEAKEKADSRNANRTVCRYVEHSGSIFKSYKVCMSAAEWENQRQLDRQQIERIQRGSCVHGAGC
ncbi:hypothetical protein [Sphingomonas sp.]|uniref:hypothetical protein n=1 Tax=Sphingomonas sp. TaxID=28214 RepID=UPI001841D762|nr:hypothetical protein [Sphingomonas sp.]MBA3510995.1 hypothetical protein [Sphingomonas sp.]